MRLLDFYPNRRIPQDHIDFCVDYHIRKTLRPPFSGWEIGEISNPVTGEAKYSAYANLINEDEDTVFSVVCGICEPTQKILDDMGLELTEVERECWVICPIIDRTSRPKTTIDAYRSSVRSFFYVEKSLPDS